MKGTVVHKYESYFHKGTEEEVHLEPHEIVLTEPIVMDVTIPEIYVCQIHSRKHINVCALESGYLEPIQVKEGQEVKAGDVLFAVKPVLYEARLAAKVAERDLAKLEFNNTERLAKQHGVSAQEVLLFKARLARAQAEVDLAMAELDFAKVKAPFDGILDRLMQMQGSLVKEGEILTTLSDNSVMWVYFNVTEKRYIEYMTELGKTNRSPDVTLILADHSEFPQIGHIGAIESNFNNQTGNIAFRADFPNPKLSATQQGLLRHGQTGTVRINRNLKDAIVIPQRSTFENLAKRYVYVVDKENKVRQREINIEHELDDIFVLAKGPSGNASVEPTDKIIFEGTRQVKEGDVVEHPKFEKLTKEDVLDPKKMKNIAQ